MNAGDTTRKGFFSVLILLLTLVSVSHAADPADVATLRSCAYCGMDRGKFSHSRMLIKYDDGTTVATCSLHCAAIDLASNIGKTPKFIGVGDYGTKKLIDAETAYWVVAGNQPGVMTSHAKWAFGEKKEAEKFIAANRGKLATFDQAIDAAFADMWQDTKQIRERRKMRMMQMKKAAP